MKRVLKCISFAILCLLMLLLALATMLEKFYGTAFVVENIYTAPWCLALWGVSAVSAFIYIISNGAYRKFAAFILHISFLFILGGALVTHLFGVRGNVHLRTDATATTVFSLSDGNLARFPFRLQLVSFNVEYYPGTHAPMDYISSVAIIDEGSVVKGTASMNNIFSYRGWRFYQSGFDADGNGAILAVSHDPYGIAVTYTGYLMLLISMIGFFFQKNSRFRRLLRSVSLKKGAMLSFILLAAVDLSAAETPRTIPRDVAAEMGNLYVYYNERICPLQTVARDFTMKLCGKDTYKGLTSEQVIAGWLFFYEEWKQEPMIKIKGSNVREILGVKNRYASLADFFSPDGSKLNAALQNSENNTHWRNLSDANEKYNLVHMLRAGTLFELSPRVTEWLTDTLSIGGTPAAYCRDLMHCLAGRIAVNEYDETVSLLHEIRKFQRESMSDVLPSDARFSAEKLYNAMHMAPTLAIFCIVLGVVSYTLFLCRLASATKHRLRKILLIAAIALLAYLGAYVVLRGYASGCFPVSNGYGTMVFMAFCSLLIALLLQKYFPMALPFGILLCGLSLMVAMMGESNPKITNLMPVLQSPLMSIHVVVIMTAYSLFAFAMLNGVTALLINRAMHSAKQVEYLAEISRIILYPAVFLLATGIFIGAVWANISWGRYWGWDPKEVWALITMLLYSLPLHDGVLSPFRNPIFLHRFCIIAFMSVLITYFGVNFVLGGMHGYA